MTELPSQDQIFLRKLSEIVEVNISREEFDVEHLAQEAKMSRSAIHRRLSYLGKLNASHFIREIRLQKAREMLHNGFATASEVSYKVGFGSPTYFSKCFHEYYGYPPGEERRREVTDEPGEQEVKHNGNGIHKPEPSSWRWSRKKVVVLGVLFSLAIASILLTAALNPFRKAREMSIVVLPFRNLSGNPENQYFADGIMEDILNSLCKVSNMRVISRTTSEHFRNTGLTTGEIARKLNTGNVLEGSVRRDGNRVRVTVQLIDGYEESHIWSESYDRTLTDLLGLQDEIARQVAVKLNAVITSDKTIPVVNQPTLNPRAWDYYLKARFLSHRANDTHRLDMSKDGLTNSIRYYELAIAEDTAFAEAYAGLANAWYTLSAWGFYKPYYDGIAKAVENFTRALELEPDCAEARTLKGLWLAYPERKFDEANAELRAALELNPDHATAHQGYAQILMITGPIEEARKHVDRAVELEPYFWVVHNLSSWIYYFEEDYEKGLEACRIARELNSDFPDNSWLFVLHYAKLGDGEKAAVTLHDLLERYPQTSPLGDEAMDSWRKDGINGIFSWLVEVNMNRPVAFDGLTGNPFFIAWWYALSGNREQAVVWLEKTLDSRSVPWHYCNLLATNPDFDVLRSDPRFISVLQKAGLASYNTRSPR
ncbi:MAG: helix-turn-helix domain-containing protein [Bacteroidales bacterium]|jgi:TolB-like protein/AraC-like DNA-binding protein|nr:helix-turn-helix domain-containing protein [Bacteroidales bacterium]